MFSLLQVDIVIGVVSLLLHGQYVPPSGGIGPWPMMTARTPTSVLELLLRLSFSFTRALKWGRMTLFSPSDSTSRKSTGTLQLKVRPHERFFAVFSRRPIP
ncbi:hypothetical protein AVEN_271554-1 [Araneus ventricosus]|uniref:Secreted protein n=1 Tax=Araneus ventricosus TaxID=182803 RepID=A0A4Y2M717_ARAVE|nr:hypothetical protein AVEN_271554-1 [Araneus ventricosus]